MNTTVVRYLSIVYIALAASGNSALASDGAIEINQAAALAGGISPGDGPGFPVTLSRSGKYLLTGNLDIPGSNGIVATVGNVTLDLNGFTVLCSGATACQLVTGISATDQTLQNINVRNGMVRGFYIGISVGNYSLVEKVTATANSSYGISVNVASVVRDCIATANGFGIVVGGGSLIAGNVVDDNSLGMCGLGGAISAYRDNILSSNTTRMCVGARLLNTGGNLCDNALCP